MDYGKWKYEQGKREREAAKKQHQTEIKGIRMRPRTDEHDFQVKLRNALKFLQEGDKVKVTVIFRSREAASEVAVVEKPPSMEGRTMTMILTPKQTK